MLNNCVAPHTIKYDFSLCRIEKKKKKTVSFFLLSSIVFAGAARETFDLQNIERDARFCGGGTTADSSKSKLRPGRRRICGILM